MHEVRHELGSPVTDHLFRESVQLPNAVPKQSGDSERGDIGRGGDEVGSLGQTIHGDKYGVIAMTLGEFRDQVDQDNLPATVWDTVGHELSCWGCQKCLRSVKEITAFHILSNVTSHTRPPVVACYQFGHFTPSQVSSHQGVVVGLHNVML